MNRLPLSAEQTAIASTLAEIQAVLEAYEAALNAADSDRVLQVFAADGVFMAPNRPSTIGTEAIRTAYNEIFQAITFDTQLTVEEVVPVASDWAFIRTRSNGHVTIKAVNQRVPDANHELFVFQKDASGTWKIARYSFATTNPLPQ